jgi:nucleotide-binding universal stress UspA family protein
MRCILAATDGSESANRAVDAAAQLAQRFEATLLIVNAVNRDVLSTDEMHKYRHVEGISLGEALASM